MLKLDQIMMLVVLLPSIFFVTVVAQCPPDWVQHGESCYGVGEDLVSWGDAAEMCEIFGGMLAEVESAEENNFLKNLSVSQNDDWYWLGATDVFHEGMWRWGSTGELIDFTDWGPGQPGDVKAQDCLGMYKYHDYQWDDGTCSNIGSFICEISLHETVVG